MSLLQRCPNCGEAHDISVYVTGQRVPCRRCALRFEVVRRDVASAAAAPEPPDPAPMQLVSPPPLEPGLASPARAPVVTVAGRNAARGARPAEPPQIEATVAAGVGPAGAARVPPKQLAGFELVDLLGRGGMGEVWRARQISLGREVAVKILSPELARDDDFIRRFEIETAALTSLSHPHVVSIIDRGRAEGLLFFAMEFVSGKSLRERIALGPVPFAEAAVLIGQVLSALAHAHRRGIVHRDLKPENVLIDEHGFAKVADFGLAAMAGPPRGERLTRSAVAMGTLSYMAPEQRRDAHGVDLRADVYSAGVVLYELLTGEVPTGRFPLPSRRRPGVPRALDPVIERALSPEPALRYQSAESMSDALVDAARTPRGLLARALGWLVAGRS